MPELNSQAFQLGLGGALVVIVLKMMFDYLKARSEGEALEKRLAGLEAKVEIAWGFIVRQAKLAMLNSGWGKKRSPLSLTEQALAKMQPHLDALLPFYLEMVVKISQEHPQATESEIEILLFQGFEHQFGNFLSEKICVPYGITNGVCVLAAIKACQQSMKRKK
jgi:hypothetical protein